MGRPTQVSIKAGRRATDGAVNLSAYLPGLLAVSVSYPGERAASVLLTREQVGELRRALAGLEPLIEPGSAPAGGWSGGERRKSAARG